MSHYLISADPTPHVTANAINKRGRRGHMLVHDRHWSLYDRRLQLPIAGLDRTTLAKIAHAVDSVPLPTKLAKTNGRPHPVGELIRALDQILEQQAKTQPPRKTVTPVVKASIITTDLNQEVDHG